ncbi:MAG: hypothetical protein ACPGL0_14450, partial [Limisphaerales bacterium]
LLLRLGQSLGWVATLWLVLVTGFLGGSLAHRQGFAVSTGSACSSGQEKPSHVMEAMGLTPNEAGRVVRFSAGWETTPTDWEGLHQALMAVYQAAQRAEVAPKESR